MGVQLLVSCFTSVKVVMGVHLLLSCFSSVIVVTSDGCAIACVIVTVRYCLLPSFRLHSCFALMY